MRLFALAALALAFAGCSLTDSGDSVAFRSLVSGAVQSPIDFAILVEDLETERVVRDLLSLPEPFDADYATETVVSVSTFGGCPDSRYGLEVVEVEADGPNVIIEAEVTAQGTAGANVITYPYDVVAIPRLEGGVTLRVIGDPSQDCRSGSQD